jgi:quercetin dioxygenase-like cupin family protein
VLLGDPGKPGPYVVRSKFPANYKMMPHTHPDNRTYTVVSGTLQLGFGDKFDAAKLKSYPAGSVFTVPTNAPHFNVTGAGEAIFQINSLGPSGTAYVNPTDDPRKK